MQTIAYPFMLLHRCSGHMLLESISESDNKLTSGQYGQMDCVKTIAAEDEHGNIRLFVLNLSDETTTIQIEFVAAANRFLLREKSVYSAELSACNTFDEPYHAVIWSKKVEKTVDSIFLTKIPKYSLSLFEFERMRSDQ